MANKTKAELEAENAGLRLELLQAGHRETAAADILKAIADSPSDAQPVFDAIVRNLMTLFSTRFAVVQLLDGGIVEMPAVGGDPGFEKIRDNYPRPLDRSTGGGIAMLEKRTVQLSPLIDNPDAPETIRRFARDF